MKLYKGAMWAGTEEALYAAQNALDKIEANLTTFKSDDDDAGSPFVKTVGSTAIISIKGPLLNADIPDEFAQWVGVTTYPGLQRAVQAVENDPNVSHVILDVDSGGGQVKGLYDTRQALLRLASSKSVETFAGECIASAAYWLGSCGKSITALPVTVAGSIGVIAVHYDTREAAKAEGYKPYVLRAGAKKHLGHSMEEFSPEAQAEVQKTLDFTHKIFMQDVAESRGMNFAVVSTTVGNGQVFYGQEAVDVGLVDKLGSFDSLMAKQSQISAFNVNRSGYTTAAQLPDVTGQVTNGEFTMNLEEAMVEIGRLNGEAEASKNALASIEAKAATLEAEKLQLEVSNKALAASLAEANSENEGYADVLKANIEAKACALGTKVLMPETLAGLKTMNAQLEGEFQTKFPSGAVAAIAQPEDKEAAQVETAPWLKRVKLEKGV